MTKKILFAFYTHIPEDLSFFEKLKLKIVQFWTNSDIYHVEIMFNEKWISADPSGINLFDIRKFDKKYEYLEIEVDTCSEQNLRIHQWLKSIEGEKYDYEGIFFRQFLDIGLQDKSKWFCSEIANKILQMYLVKPFIRLESSTLSPKDIYSLLLKNKATKKIKAAELNEFYQL
jgi:hypothetical protein